MAPSNIILYSTRALGYVYNNGAYGSQHTLARTFTRDQAAEYMKRHVTHDGASPLLPVDLDLLNEVLGAA